MPASKLTPSALTCAPCPIVAPVLTSATLIATATPTPVPLEGEPATTAVPSAAAFASPLFVADSVSLSPVLMLTPSATDACALDAAMLMPIAPATLILLPPLPPVSLEVSADGELAPPVPFLVESFSFDLPSANASSLLTL